jgi:CRISPR system Cascade subunit CasA
MNLLTDPVFRVDTPSVLERLDLPGLLEALGTDRLESLLGLQRHQEDAFHIFLCYLAGAVLAREGQEDPRQEAGFWREGIRRLTRADGGGDDGAWTLVVRDPTLPAFMQPPCPTTADFKELELKAKTPDGVDLLPTAKNHDLKANRVGHPEPDDWIYALISLQTMSGVFGNGKYGISRMNSGAGSRSVVALSYATTWGERWREHTTRIMALRPELLAQSWHYRSDGLVCTWIPPWDRHSSLVLSTLDPFFIEACRVVRLVGDARDIRALGATSKSQRIAAKAANGDLGDPWTPINLKNKSALTVSANGLTPSLLRDLMFQDGFALTGLQLPTQGRAGQHCRFTASVLVRGIGTTDGFYQAIVPIPHTSARRMFGRGPEHDRLAALSKTAIEDSGTMQNRILKASVYSLLEAGPQQVDFEKREVTAWWGETQRSFAAAWSADFFPWLWRTAEHPDLETARLEWLQALKQKAEAALTEAIARYPTRAGRRYRAQVRAQGVFHGLLRKHFPVLTPTPIDDQGETAHDDTSHG